MSPGVVYTERHVTYDDQYSYSAVDDLVSSRRTENGEVLYENYTLSGWAESSWFYQRVETNTVYDVYMSGGGTGHASTTTETITSSGTHNLYPFEYEYFGQAGAYRTLPGLPADWSDLERENAPYIFNGGWNNYFTDAPQLESLITTNQDAVQQSVEVSGLYDGPIVPYSQKEYEAEQERLRREKAEEEARQAALQQQSSTSTQHLRAGSMRAELRAPHMTEKHREQMARGVENAKEFQDMLGGMTPGVGVVYEGYKAITGYNPITEREMSATERGLSGVVAILGIIPAAPRGTGLIDDGL